MEGDHCKPELIVALEDKHHFIALLDSKGKEIVGASGTFLLYIQERESTFNLVFVQVDLCKFFRVFFSNCIHHIKIEVERVCILELNALQYSVFIFFAFNELLA